jgi:hypothetical protein
MPKTQQVDVDAAKKIQSESAHVLRLRDLCVADKPDTTVISIKPVFYKYYGSSSSFDYQIVALHTHA